MYIVAVHEGIYLFRNGIDPYSGGTFRHVWNLFALFYCRFLHFMNFRLILQSPLYLSLFSTVLPESNALSAVLWTLADAIGAWALVQIWRARSRTSKGRRDWIIAAVCVRDSLLSSESFFFSQVKHLRG